MRPTQKKRTIPNSDKESPFFQAKGAGSFGGKQPFFKPQPSQLKKKATIDVEQNNNTAPLEDTTEHQFDDLSQRKAISKYEQDNIDYFFSPVTQTKKDTFFVKQAKSNEDTPKQDLVVQHSAAPIQRWNPFKAAKDAVSSGIDFVKDLPGKAKNALSSGVDFVKGLPGKTMSAVKNIGSHFIQPLRGVYETGKNVVKGAGGKITEAWQTTDFKWTDIFSSPLLPIPTGVLRFGNNLRQITLASAAKHAKNAGMPGPIPGAINKLNSAADKVADIAGKGFEIQHEIIEGAVLGDFKENPGIWNTVGQIAIGFVPYAGQVADIRDLIASIKKLHEKGWKDPGEWFNLILTVIGLVPGIGDMIKGAGRFLEPISKFARKLMPNAGAIWKIASKHGKALFSGASTLGKKLLGSAANIGKGVFKNAKNWGSGLLKSAKGLGSRALKSASGMAQRAKGMLKSAMANAGSIASKAMGFLGKIMGPIKKVAEGIISGGKKALNGALDLVRKGVQRGTDIFKKIRSAAAKRIQQAAARFKSTLAKAAAIGKKMMAKARDMFKKGVSLIRRKAAELKAKAIAKAQKMVQDGVKWAKKNIVSRVKRTISTLRGKTEGFLRKKWNDLKERIHTKKEGSKPELPSTKKLPLPEKEKLIAELAEQGIKHDANNITAIAKNAEGKIVFLENGDSSAGLQHILGRHKDDFARAGIDADQIPDLVIKAATEGTIVGHQGKGTGRPIYEIVFNGVKKHVAITISDNGFIVGANPSSI